MLYFQDLRLFLCRLTRGASSQAYQLLVKKLSQGHKTQQKLTICFNNEAILQFENTILKKKSFPVFKTKNKICLDTFSFGEEMTNIIRQKGPPHCINNDVFGEEIIEIFGYRESILDKPVKILFFTCRKKYFFGEYLFTGKFREIQAQLAQTILKKYNIQDLSLIHI